MTSKNSCYVYPMDEWMNNYLHESTFSPRLKLGFQTTTKPAVNHDKDQRFKHDRQTHHRLSALPAFTPHFFHIFFRWMIFFTCTDQNSFQPRPMPHVALATASEHSTITRTTTTTTNNNNQQQQEQEQESQPQQQQPQLFGNNSTPLQQLRQAANVTQSLHLSPSGSVVLSPGAPVYLGCQAVPESDDRWHRAQVFGLDRRSFNASTKARKFSDPGWTTQPGPPSQG